jgi:hypothetical protein
LLEDKEFEGVQWNQDPRNRTLKLRTLNQLNHEVSLFILAVMMEQETHCYAYGYGET